MKKIFFVLLVLVLAVGAGYASRRGFGAPPSEVASDGADPKTTTVFRGPMDVVINATGKVVAHQVVEVKSKAGGEVVRVAAEAGDTIARGDLLVELDPADEQRSVLIAEAQLLQEEARLASARSSLELTRSTYRRSRDTATSDVESARAALEEARRRHERQKELFEQGGAISAQEYDTARSAWIQAQSAHESAQARLLDSEQQKYAVEQREHEITLAEAQLAITRARLEDARQRLSETRIVAPVAGVLTEKIVEVGQVISSALSNVGGGTTLLKISDTSRLYVDASIDEVDIGQIRAGLGAAITADAYPTERFVGEVLRVAPQGVEVNNVVVFDVRLEIAGDGLRFLKPGMTVNVAIEAGRREAAILLPVQAIFYEGDQAYALRDDHPDEMKATRVYFAGGLTDGVNVEVLDGLEEGDVVKVRPTFDNKRWRRSR